MPSVVMDTLWLHMVLVMDKLTCTEIQQDKQSVAPNHTRPGVAAMEGVPSRGTLSYPGLNSNTLAESRGAISYS